MNTVRAHFNTRKVPRPAMSRSSAHKHLGMPIPCLTRLLGAPLTIYFVLIRAQNLHTRHPSTQSSDEQAFQLELVWKL